MLLQDFVTQDMVNAAAGALGLNVDDVQITRINSLTMPSPQAFKVIRKVQVGNTPFINFTALHNKEFKINYGMTLNISTETKTKFVFWSSYADSYGELVILFTKKGYVKTEKGIICPVHNYQTLD